jgi:dTDP-4-amino-4,6-dideoxygalactose transaminase
MDTATIAKRIRDDRLAIDGGEKVRASPMPRRMAMGDAEIAMLNEALSFYRDQGVDPGYQGPFEKRYTDDFVAMMGGGYADSVATGSGALWLAVAALDLPKGSEVICSPVTDPGTLAAITMNGLKPRLGDAKPDNYNMGADQVAARLGPNVSAVMAVHASGQATDIDRIVELAHARGVKVIEDCSQSHGARVNGRPIGTFGDIAAFSTMYRKIHMTGGSGGVVYSRDVKTFRNALAHADRGKPRWEKDFDDRNPETYLFPALNWNTDELSCAIGIASLRRLTDTVVRRLAFVSELASLVAEMDLMFRLHDWTPQDSPFILPVYVDMARATRSKVEIAEAVRAEGIDLNPHYRYVVADWPYIKPFLADGFDTPVARDNRDRSFCLYLNENYGETEAADTAAALLKVHRALAKEAPKGERPKVIPIAAR